MLHIQLALSFGNISNFISVIDTSTKPISTASSTGGCSCPASESGLQELLAKAVKAIRIGEQDTIELELANGQIIGKEPAQ